jgi:hypothetical protein
MPDARSNLTHGYGRLQRDVRCAINIHAGNTVRLEAQHGEVMRFLEMLNLVCTLSFFDFSQSFIAYLIPA